MAKIMILNGSPRAPKSNSKRYAALFAKYCSIACAYFEISKSNHAALRSEMEKYSDVLFVFPLYADALPVGFLNFLKFLENNPPTRKPVVSILINCGFFEYNQNEIAVRMMRLFCRQNHYALGSVLMLGSGEAILDSPFQFLAAAKIKQLAASIVSRSYRVFHVTMPLTRKLFQLASTYYWVQYGKKFGVTKKQMQTMEIESAGEVRSDLGH